MLFYFSTGYFYLEQKRPEALSISRELNQRILKVIHKLQFQDNFLWLDKAQTKYFDVIMKEEFREFTKIEMVEGNNCIVKKVFLSDCGKSALKIIADFPGIMVSLKKFAKLNILSRIEISQSLHDI